MFSGRRLVLIGALTASTALAIALGVKHPNGHLAYPTRFMVWNLSLAWMPLVFATLFTTARNRVIRAAFALAWLAFLPNAPYLVTDLVHLRDGSGDVLWRHILQFGFAAWNGVLLGVVSLRIVHLEIERRHGRLAGWCLAFLATGLCAVGVVIGRFQRYNSWDLVSQPKTIALTTLHWVRSPISNVRSTGVAIAVAGFFGLAYLCIWALEGLNGSGQRAAVRPRATANLDGA